jgi:hypothetical protein
VAFVGLLIDEGMTLARQNQPVNQESIGQISQIREIRIQVGFSSFRWFEEP